jgi:hypothetical protein
MKRARLHAPKQGRVTRKSRLIRIRQKHNKPLPMDLQVLPQRLDPTPTHPNCATEGRHWGEAARLHQTYASDQFRAGVELHKRPSMKRRYRIACEGRNYYVGSALFGMAWCAAARMNYVQAELFIIDGEAIC